MPSNLQTDSADNGNNQWTEEAIKTCLYLYLDLMPVNHSLIHPLVFTKKLTVMPHFWYHGT